MQKYENTKTNTTVVGNNYMKHFIQINTVQLEKLSKFKYVGSVRSQHGKSDEDIKDNAQWEYYFKLLFNSTQSTIFATNLIPVQTKIYKKVSVPISIYEWEPWVTTRIQRKKQAPQR